MRDGCPFCEYEGPSPILASYGDAYVIEPITPVVTGHVLVIPIEHVEHAAEKPLVTGRVFAWAARYIRERTLDLDVDLRAWNLITSIGEAATQTVTHLHVHVVPRAPGDTLALPWDRR